jgi:hypothetical protein
VRVGMWENRGGWMGGGDERVGVCVRVCVCVRERERERERLEYLKIVYKRSRRASTQPQRWSPCKQNRFK